MDLPQTDDYQRLFIENVPLLDVRAPTEFMQGAFPQASNFPLLDDEQRRKVGLQYKEQGQDRAIALGHALVSGEIRNSRITDWSTFVKRNPHGALYCFRGGLRSKISQQWIYENTGVNYPRVKGGYKAMRRFLIDQLEVSVNTLQPIILTGRTGIGKTLLLSKVQQKVDLENIFHHRGSVFGKHVDAQPSQIDIENRLSIELLTLRHKGATHILLEDESANIGSRRIPTNVFKQMRQSPLVFLEAGMDARVENIFNEYIRAALAEYQQALGETAGFEAWATNLQSSLDKIQKRLGGLRYKGLKETMLSAIHAHQIHGDSEKHKDWIKKLLAEYYDPMYDYQLARKQERLVFRGDQKSVEEFLSFTYGFLVSS